MSLETRPRRDVRGQTLFDSLRHRIGLEALKGALLIGLAGVVAAPVASGCSSSESEVGSTSSDLIVFCPLGEQRVCDPGPDPSDLPQPHKIIPPVCHCEGEVDASIPAGTCKTASDCHGPLPQVCMMCGDGSHACAHFKCDGGKCSTEICPAPTAPVCTKATTAAGQTTAGETVKTVRGVYTLSFVDGGEKDPVTRTTSISVDGLKYIDSTFTRLPSGAITSDATFGPQAQGVTKTHFESADGITFTGVVDGRQILPFKGPVSASTKYTFADGKPAPSFVVSPDIDTEIKALMAKESSESCMPKAAPSPAAAPTTEGVVPFSSSPGHSDNPAASFACIACQSGCVTAGTGCAIGVAVGSAACLWAYAACVIAGEAVCALAEVGCQFACRSGGAPCCPTQCGNACCDKQDSCLNSGIGTCCGPGTTGCMGKSCCAQSDVCLSTGTCCPGNQNSCNGACCAPGETCAGNAGCCNPSNVCGNACCPVGGTCLDPSRSLCCGGLGQVSCGDKCCGVGETCIANGQYCCPQAQACGTVCCGAGQDCLNPSTGQCGQACSGGKVSCQYGNTSYCCFADEHCNASMPGCCGGSEPGSPPCIIK